jgi:ATP-dependent RNA helicase RhlE
LTATTPTHPVDARVGASSVGTDRPAGFGDLGVSEPVAAALARRGIRAPSSIQSLVLPDAIAGRDVLARSRTGSGKTLAFALPIVERLSRHGRAAALVLVPTRELTTLVAGEFGAIAEATGLSVATVYGGVNIAKQIKAATRADIVVATPGRLLDLLQRRLLRLNRVGIIVLDEADRMLDMGFLPDVTTILSVLPPERQTMLFSATLDGDVGRLAARFTTDPVRQEVAEGRAVDADLGHRFVAVDAAQQSGHGRPRDGRPARTTEALDALMPWQDDAVNAWEAYLAVGGFPQAVVDYLETGSAGTP